MLLALAQMHVEPGAPNANLARAERMITAARDRGAAVVLLPEALDCGWTHSSAHLLAGRIPGGDACERLRSAALAAGIHVCAGLVEREGERLYNAAVLIAPDGRLLLHHRKIHEIDFARALYARGDRLGVADTALGRVGLMICADGFAPGQSLSRALGEMGAELILSPCAWAVPPDHDQGRTPYGALWVDNYGPPARDHGMTIAGCSNVGPVVEGEWRDWRCIGCSLVIGPDGATLARGGYGLSAEELIMAEVDPNPARRHHAPAPGGGSS